MFITQQYNLTNEPMGTVHFCITTAVVDVNFLLTIRLKDNGTTSIKII
jgi:hypothetical protein